MAGTEDLPAGSLDSVLDSTELEGISSSIKEKIEQLYNSKDTELESLKSKYEKLLVNSEQQYFEIEKQLITSNKKLETESASNVELKQRLTEIEDKYSSAASQLKDTKDVQESALSTQLRLNRSNEQLESDKRDLTVLLEKKNKEIDTINEEWKELTKKASKANTEKCEAQANLSEAQSKCVSLEFQNKRLAQEKQQLQQQLDLLDKQLFSKTSELLTIRKEQSSNLLDVQSRYEEKVEENKLQQETIETLKKTNADQVSKIETYIQKLKDIRDTQTQSEEQFRQELQAKTRLTDLYKKSSEEADNQVKELTRAVEELQRLLKEAAEAHTELEKTKVQDVKLLQLEIQDQEETVSKLKSELVNANDLLEQARSKAASEEKVETMFPTAAATSKLVKSGMTLTQIYNEYVQASDALMLEKEENQRLNLYLDQILQEIEEKAPLLKKQREDYENAQNSIEQLTKQLDSGLLEAQKHLREAEDMNRKYNHMRRENQRFQQEKKDLSRQVQYLLKEMQEIKGGRVRREEEVSSNDVTSSGQVITDHLVTFRDVEELQTQNERLLAVIRELGEKREEQEKFKVESKTKEVKDKLDLALSEIQELKSVRSQQTEMLEAVIKQRDMYRVLMMQDSQASLSLPPAITSTPGPTSVPSPTKSPLMGGKSPTIEKSLQETSTALKQLQEEFTHYKKEKSENERMLNTQLEKWRQDNSEMRLQNTKLLSQLDFAAERYKVLQGNAEGYRKEIAALRDKNQKHSSSVAKHEQTINTLRQDLMVSQEKVARAEAQSQNLKTEVELLKGTEQRLIQEVEAVRREKQSQSMLMANLQSIQNSLQHSEFEIRTQYNKKIESLELQVSSLERKLKLETAEHKELTKIWENQNKTAREQLDSELKSHDNDKQLIHSLKDQLQATKQQLSATEEKLSSAEARLTNAITDSSDPAVSSQIAAEQEAVKDLQAQLKQNQQELNSTKEKLRQAQQNVDQYKSIADGLQKTMTEQSQATNKYEEKYEELKEAKTRAEKRCEEVEKERTNLVNENVRLSEESHTLNADLRKQLSNLQNELQEAVQRRELAITKETAALQESQTQIGIAKEMQDKYQRELMLHAADVEALTTVKKQMDSFNEKLAMEQECRMKAEKKFEAAKNSWENQEKILRQNASRLEQRCKDLNSQNALLHQQMEKMSREVIAVQQAVTRRESLTSSAEDTSKSSEQLLEVVKFLRKEKEIAETKLEVVQAETANIRQQLERVSRQLEETNKALREERESSQVSLHTAAQHAELMRKVENYNLLSDSNRLLREEKERLDQQVQTLEAKLKKLEGDIEPMQAVIREISAQRDAYNAEKSVLEEEVNRWKSRTNHLIEQANKTDPEEHRKLIQERETLRRELARITEESHKSRADASRLNNNLSSVQKELNTTKSEITQMTKELNSAKSEITQLTKKEEEQKAEVVEKDKELDERQKTINQLKKIGRKYKEQAENIGKELEELKQSQQEPPQPSPEAVQQATAAIQDKLTASEKEVENLKQQLGQKETELNTNKEEHSKLQQEANQQKQEFTKLKEDKEEMDKKLNQSKQVLQAAKKKIGAQNEQLEKLSTENNELKQKAASAEKASDVEAQKLKTSFDEKLAKMEQEVKDAKTASESAASTVTELQAVIDRLSEENTELQNRVQQLQKQLEPPSQPVPPQPQVPRSSASVSVERTSAPTTESPKTANIKPMASPATVRTQASQIQLQSAATKATASIRPMAIAPTAVTPISVSVPTPMATVMPTTVSVPDTQGTDSSSASQLSPATTSRPTSHVQRVPPQVEIGSDQAPVSQETDMASTSQPETAAVEPQPSTSSAREGPITSSQGKRTREDMESQEEEIEPKRTKVSVEPQTLPSITVTDEHANTMALQSSESTQEVEVVAPPTKMEEESWSQASTQVFTEATEDSQVTLPDFEAVEQEDEVAVTQEEGQGDDDAIIVLGSEDEEEEDDEEEEYEEEADDEDYEEPDEYDENEDEGEEEAIDEDEYEEGEGEVEQEGFQARTTEADVRTEEADAGDDEDVVIVENWQDDEENSTQMDSQETESSAVTQTVAPSTQTMISQRPMPALHTIERQTSIPRTQLAPFVLAGQTGAFEDHGDDSIVPSTPTLFVPNRGDGFAEAVSSPQIPHQRFTFTSGVDVSSTQHELAQLESQGALGFDDTRMDLSQLEEGSGRSVPTTPSHITPPVVLTEGADSTPSQSEPVISGETPADQDTETTTQEGAGDSAQDVTDSASVEQTTEVENVGETTADDKTEPSEVAVVEEAESGDAVSNKEDASSASTSQERPDSSGKPKKIQPIVWEGPVHTQPTRVQEPSPIQTQISHPQGQFQGHFHGGRGNRGMGNVRLPSQHHRGRGNFSRGRGQAPRGQRAIRSNRGNMYGRPPMY